MAASAPPRNTNLRPVTTSGDTDALDPISIQEVLRQSQIKRNWDAVKGVFPDSLKRKRGANPVDYNVKANLIKGPVRKIANFLAGKEVGIEVKPPVTVQPLAPVATPATVATATPAAPDPAQTYLDEFWETNKKVIFTQKCVRYGIVTGDAFVKLVMDPGKMYPRLVVLDPATVEVTTAPDDCDTAIAFTTSYQAVYNKQTYDCQQRITQDDGGQSWTIQDFRRPANKDGASWRAMNDPQSWLYPFPPIFHAPNTINPGSYHGEPNVTEDIIHLNLVINFVLSNLNKAVHFFGTPRTLAKNLGGDVIPADPENVIKLPSDKSEMSLLQGNVDVAGAMQLIDRLKGFLNALMSVPGLAMGELADVPKGQISALAIELLFAPLLDLVNEMRMPYGQMLADICTAVLQIAGYGINRRVKLNWPKVLPLDYAAMAQAALGWEQAGVSQQTAIETLGDFDYDLEQQRVGTKTPSLADAILSKFNQGADLPPMPVGAGAPGGN